MPLNILFPDCRFAQLDVEREVTGPDAILNGPRKDRFDSIELSAWENCDGIAVTRIPIDAAAVARRKRARIVVRHGGTRGLQGVRRALSRHLRSAFG